MFEQVEEDANTKKIRELEELLAKKELLIKKRDAELKTMIELWSKVVRHNKE